jgi:hypothetical protein
MRGRFQSGHIEVEGDPYPDGTAVNFVVLPGDNEEYELTPEEEDALEQSIAEIERGDCVTAEVSLEELRTMRLRDGR